MSILAVPILQVLLILTVVTAVVCLIIQLRDQRDSAGRLLTANEELRKRVDDHKKMEDELRSKEDWYKLLFQNTNDMVFVHGLTEDGLPGQFLDVNDVACSVLKYGREELFTMTPLDIEVFEQPAVSPGYSAPDLVTLSDEYIRDRQTKIVARPARLLMDRILAERQVQYEKVYRDRNGRTFPVEVHARRFDLLGRPMIMYTSKDITERHSAEKALNESRQHFRDFFSHSPIGIAMYDAERRLVDVNRSCLKMLGIPDSQEFAKFNLFDNPFLPPVFRDRLNRGENVRYEAVVDFATVVQQMRCVTSRTGRANFDILITTMEPDKDFLPRGYFAQVQDVTERRKAEAELRHREQQLQQAEKMEAIGSMAGGIAHDFNNTLTPILGYAEMILRQTQPEEQAHELTQGIVKAANRAKELANQILTFSRKTESPEEQQIQPIRITPIAKEVLALQRTSLPPNIEIRRVIRTERDIVVANPTKIHQVLMNLCTNAGYAMRENGGVLELLMSDFAITGRTKSEYPQLEPGRYLRISVSDTGSGMDKATAGRIFEPFFTTKRVGEGTGMGLTQAKRIVTEYKGLITFDTEQGKGSTFHVILPAVEEGEVVEQEAGTLAPLLTGHERILIVDDDPPTIEVIATMLSSMGYQPMSANHGNGALRLFTINPRHFDLVITDQVMPAMTGVELAVKLHAIRPELPIVICTGVHDSVTPEDMKVADVQELILKPIVMEHLSTSIRRALDRKRARTT